ncbi:MAG TPA: hypothetical protein VFL31_07490 [Nitrospiraceae bacterium]|nr:hypothetical protein [Nitrospiraceae bacterium]
MKAEQNAKASTKQAPATSKSKWPAAAIAKATSLKRQGASDRAISRELRAMKLTNPRGGEWWSTTVAALLRDSGYKATKAAKPKAGEAK